MQGLGGALRLFVAVLWLADSQLVGNAAQTIAGALFFNQSCAQVRVTSYLPACCAQIVYTAGIYARAATVQDWSMEGSFCKEFSYFT